MANRVTGPPARSATARRLLNSVATTRRPIGSTATAPGPNSPLAMRRLTFVAASTANRLPLLNPAVSQEAGAQAGVPLSPVPSPTRSASSKG